MTTQLKRMALAMVSFCSLSIAGACSSRSSMPASAPPPPPGAETTPPGSSAPTSDTNTPQASPPGQGTGTEAQQASGSGESPGPGPGSATPYPTDAGTAACSKACRTDDDCACGTDTQTHQCAYGNKSCIDTSRQCPDFCTGINGQLRLRCVRRQCTLM